ncbi:uncharacterized protein Bfra_003631 [Botrytis fragariae]|uniref:Uncharacterized protein n=1 Tax=Botrytis fragariae TaxID=1964551 RepID=A0A8H6EK32_9HELO|nr:uncharacterized protein Bfra_003631 [Botrytis fragariae]KAF5875178.1 hypothetical protein Bfra_003631 [Botrytis fragariae]
MLSQSKLIAKATHANRTWAARDTSALGLLDVTALEASSKDSYWLNNGDNNHSRRSLRSETNDLRHEESINFRRRKLQSSTGTTCRSSTI